jgi:hypothetical protein
VGSFIDLINQLIEYASFPAWNPPMISMAAMKANTTRKSAPALVDVCYGTSRPNGDKSLSRDAPATVMLTNVCIPGRE